LPTYNEEFPQAMTDPLPEKTVRARDLCALLQRSLRSVFRIVKQPDFPRPLAIRGRRWRRWRLADVEHWMRSANNNPVPVADRLTAALAKAVATTPEPVASWLRALLAGDQDAGK
jgi:predicted DNA-binding transcriptional regulator AlpA